MNAEEVLNRYISFKKSSKQKTEILLEFILERQDRELTEGEQIYIQNGIKRIKDLENMACGLLDIYVQLISNLNNTNNDSYDVFPKI